MSEQKAKVDKNQLALKNRKIFTDVHTIFGVPALLFMIGICISIISLAVFRSFIVGALTSFFYFVPMLAVHKNDIRGLKIWSSCLFSPYNYWMGGTRSKIRFIIKEKVV